MNKSPHLFQLGKASCTPSAKKFLFFGYLRKSKALQTLPGKVFLCILQSEAQIKKGLSPDKPRIGLTLYEVLRAAKKRRRMR